ncbi:DUF2267 domain-containing protein [Kitasatospora sp. NPDC096077]|uniref:DUF2267 domain-containing protein n=1 Tax=Kitasatospora sp. NPDC096077 TaxID=3155544 RepID=UPI00331AF4C9
MTRHSLLQDVRTLGSYPTDEEAGHVLDTVLGVLGSQLTGTERCELAAILPDRARAALVAPAPRTEPLTAPAFVDTVARSLDTSRTGARWGASCVLTALADLAGPEATDRLLAQLPRGYALLFGRADLLPAA